MEHFFVHAEERAQHRPAYPREGVALRFGEEVQLVEAPRPAHRLEEPFAKPLRRVVHGFEVLRAASCGASRVSRSPDGGYPQRGSL